MKAKELRELIDFISQSPLDEVHIETDEFKLSVKRNSSKVIENVVATTPVVAQQQPIVTQAVPQNTPNTTPQSTEEKKEVSEENYLTIKSPMIGTFYRAPDPDSPAFTNIGDEVSVGQTVCIVEAMKLFNEIESEVAGRIVKVLVENASPVEYDQPLFLVEPI
ncbi:MAG: acetyl-CoA carboxylase biotin carboxyl carrier protein [Thermonemataceae bacterium]